jgi:hypothetical protein
MHCVALLIDWLNRHDPPNWATALFSLIVWPLALVWWQWRTVNSVSGLEIVLSSGQVFIGPAGAAPPYKAITVAFNNRTGSVAYLTSPRVTVRRKSLPVTPAADMDATTGAQIFAFVDDKGVLQTHELTIQTDGRASGAIALSEDAPAEFYRYTASRWRRYACLPKYFVLEFRAVVGARTYNVKMIH